MKILITDCIFKSSDYGHRWAVTGACFGNTSSCSTCSFINNHICTVHYRTELIKLLNIAEFPFEFDTDKYPELFI